MLVYIYLRTAYPDIDMLTWHDRLALSSKPVELKRLNGKSACCASLVLL